MKQKKALTEEEKWRYNDHYGYVEVMLCLNLLWELQKQKTTFLS